MPACGIFYQRQSFRIISATLLLLAAGLSAEGYQDDPAVSRIIIDYDSVICLPGNEYNNIKTGNEIILGARNNNIGFEILPEGRVSYQFFLSGFDRNFTDWQKSGFKEYTNLPPGRYELNVRYRTDQGNTGEIASLNIRVLPLWYFSKPAIISYFILFFLLIWVLYESLGLQFARKQFHLEQIINKRTEDLIVEKEKSETLLANIFPKNTADELMAKGKATKMKYDFVTVLFSDIQGFTQIAEEMNPEVLIDELDKFFFHFDSVVEKYGIEKIKTIGDAYMCAGGIPEKNRTNPVEVILAALEMQEYMTRMKESSLLQGMKYWDIRIGIHTGTVVAGVVGQKKLSYDIWGDTVNTASRMESSGEAGKINISGTTYEFVKDFFICDYRGKMPVKYKGELDMYFVRGIMPGLSEDNNVPNDKFQVRLSLLRVEDVEDKVNSIYEEKTPPNLYFHNVTHARNVMLQADLLSRAEKLPDEEYVDLRLASVFLLTGYMTDYENPAKESCNLAEEILPRYGFEEEIIRTVVRIISDVFMQKYDTAVSMILHDALYSYLGREDYIELTDKLLREKKEHGRFSDTQSWVESQKELLLKHDFMTTSGKHMRSVSVENQINMLKVYNK